MLRLNCSLVHADVIAEHAISRARRNSRFMRISFRATGKRRAEKFAAPVASTRRGGADGVLSSEKISGRPYIACGPPTADQAASPESPRHRLIMEEASAPCAASRNGQPSRSRAVAEP